MKISSISNCIPKQIFITKYNKINETENIKNSNNQGKLQNLKTTVPFAMMVSFGNWSNYRERNSDVNFDYFKIKAPLIKGQIVKPDEFQIDAARQLQAGNSVIVCAPTGTGKTAIAQYIMSKNLKDGKKTFYTTPLKALSNQKLSEFRKIYGKENVGILTGDRKENADAPIVVMTTEVYRNMGFDDYFSKKSTRAVDTIVFDEFHYLGDVSRGISWEEAIMYSPRDVQILALSATIGNHEHLADWLSSISGRDCVDVFVPASERSIPLKYEFFNCERKNGSKDNSKYYKAHVNSERARVDKVRMILNNYIDLVKKLKYESKLPAIFFVYSKSMNHTLLREAAANGETLTNEQERAEIQRRLDVARLETDPEKYLGKNLNEKALLKGYAMHNAGLMPGEKAFVENLFADNLLKVVFATETLSAGINMPARTVVISSPIKFSADENGILAPRLLTSNEYHQMAGRAGRRGLDTKTGGYVVNFCVENSNARDFNSLIVSEPDSIVSRFNPSYSLLVSCLAYNDTLDDIVPFAEKSFRYQTRVRNIEKGDSDLPGVFFKKAIQRLVEAKKELLLMEGFISESDNNKLYVTEKGRALRYIVGYPQIPIINTINSGILSTLSPAELVFFAATLVDSMDCRLAGLDKNEPLAGEDKKESLLSEALDNAICLYNSKQPTPFSKLKPSDKWINSTAVDRAMRMYCRFNNKYNKEIALMPYSDEVPKELNIRYSPRVALFAIMNREKPDESLNNWEKIDEYIIKNRIKSGKQTEYSGEFFFRTSQTIDLLNQILDMCSSKDMEKNKHFTVLVDNLKEAIALIQKPPIPSYQET